MARKKGRPPKSPSQHLSSPSASTPPTSIPKNLDLEHLDDEDFEDIDALSPKKATSILRKLDALRSRIKGKANEGDKEGNTIADAPNQPDSIEKEISPKRASVESGENQLPEVEQSRKDQQEGPWTPDMTRRKAQNAPILTMLLLPFIHEGVKAEEIYEKTGEFPDPNSTDNAEFKIALSIIRVSILNSRMRVAKSWIA
ncbi:hypothetical protein RIF29_02006 [Crotalaria pallida]|uniref:Uncharacterized protein n=1 Tax=Crotalaria pallida TaxID=3830 RepID=A0AAN9P7R4_CROPI